MGPERVRRGAGCLREPNPARLPPQNGNSPRRWIKSGSRAVACGQVTTREATYLEHTLLGHEKRGMEFPRNRSAGKKLPVEAGQERPGVEPASRESPACGNACERAALARHDRFATTARDFNIRCIPVDGLLNLCGVVSRSADSLANARSVDSSSTRRLIAVRTLPSSYESK